MRSCRRHYFFRNPVGAPAVIRVHRLASPFVRPVPAGNILQNVALPVLGNAGRPRCRSRRYPRSTHRRIHRNYDPSGSASGARGQRRAIRVPERSCGILEQLGIEFLPAEPRASQRVRKAANAGAVRFASLSNVLPPGDNHIPTLAPLTLKNFLTPAAPFCITAPHQFGQIGPSPTSTHFGNSPIFRAERSLSARAECRTPSTHRR
jgi:hypothetical protein